MLSVPASAQRKSATSGTAGPRHEIGFDLEASYTKPATISGGFVAGLPVDIRVGFLTHKKLMFEPRLSVAFNSVAMTTTYLIAPGLNVLYQRRPGTGPYNLMHALYVTGGVALDIFDLDGLSGTQVAINGGVGKRVPFGSDAARFEGFVRCTFQGGGAGSNLAIGARAGVSFWH